MIKNHHQNSKCSQKTETLTAYIIISRIINNEYFHNKGACVLVLLSQCNATIFLKLLNQMQKLYTFGDQTCKISQRKHSIICKQDAETTKRSYQCNSITFVKDFLKQCEKQQKVGYSPLK